MPKTKKPRSADPLKGLPLFRHQGDPPAELISEFNKAYRRIATIRHKHIPRERWRKFVRDRDSESMMWVCDLIVECMDPNVIDRFCPPWQASLTNSKLDYTATKVRWWRTTSTTIKGRTIYHHARRPQIQLPDVPGNWIIGFSVHAILRAQERMNICSNIGRMSIGSLLACNTKGVMAEPDVVDGQQGFWIWSQDCPGAWTYSAVQTLLDNNDYPPRKHWVRSAWCPVDLIGKFAVAKTALAPAMTVPGIKAALTVMYSWTDREVEEWKKLHAALPMIRRIPGDYLT